MTIELFPDFEAMTLEGDGADIFLRLGGEGPPLLLLHGFPQTHVMWSKVAGTLAREFTVVVPDLRGCGASSCPDPDNGHTAYSKRAMGRDMGVVMAELGHDRFAVVGHDRGGRVAYRMALDAPETIERIAVLDIVPTHDMWCELNKQTALLAYHWMFLAQPYPMPEMLIGATAREFVDFTLASWTGSKDLAAFSPGALDAYRSSFCRPKTIRAMCEDYRAGATCDHEADIADLERGAKITAPLAVIWGDKGIPDATVASPLATWAKWADTVSGGPIPSGHFLAEENGPALLKLLLPFLKAN
ncbi:Hydrolase, alpha/beta fold family [hydrothermal vent metagenome]|uniref:Hydrolase, alpha/beta fold family n=1 Tax=hydrothermal vent metagenome TaxID=652676 RepID=A0A3B0TDJ4_9ZZZZ